MDRLQPKAHFILVLVALNAGLLVIDRFVAVPAVLVLLAVVATIAASVWVGAGRGMPRPVMFAVVATLAISVLELLDAGLLPTVRV